MSLTERLKRKFSKSVLGPRNPDSLKIEDFFFDPNINLPTCPSTNNSSACSSFESASSGPRLLSPEPTVDERERFQATLDTPRLQPTLHRLQKDQISYEELGAADSGSALTSGPALSRRDYSSPSSSTRQLAGANFGIAIYMADFLTFCFVHISKGFNYGCVECDDNLLTTSRARVSTTVLPRRSFTDHVKSKGFNLDYIEYDGDVLTTSRARSKGFNHGLVEYDDTGAAERASLIVLIPAFPKGTVDKPLARPKNRALVPHVKAGCRTLTSIGSTRLNLREVSGFDVCWTGELFYRLGIVGAVHGHMLESSRLFLLSPNSPQKPTVAPTSTPLFTKRLCERRSSGAYPPSSSGGVDRGGEEMGAAQLAAAVRTHSRLDAWMRIVEVTIDGRGKMESLVGASEEVRGGGIGMENLVMA
ncbi:hypothetical protein JMJ35_000394 [Cladonia borealis]|uniref:Uncharacterized protein n=1 Tax=Cladonia borealis TaxID=184061 RepID=A0AA39RB64_9LECA|nr:hypothetical protein JMJ35_000394 [Cladonia borealis]